MQYDFWRSAKFILLRLAEVDINEQLRLECEYLRVQNQVLKAKLTAEGRHLHFTDEQRRSLAIKGKVLGSRLHQVATIVRAQTILAWYRKFDKSGDSEEVIPRKVGRPRIAREIEKLVIKMDRENRTWGYERISGSMKNLGFSVCPATVLNILKRNGIGPTGIRNQESMAWIEFIKLHKEIYQFPDINIPDLNFLANIYQTLEAVFFLACKLTLAKSRCLRFNGICAEKVEYRPNYNSIELHNEQVKNPKFKLIRPPPLSSHDEKYQDAA